MSKRVLIAEDPLSPESWAWYEGEDVLALIRRELPAWPATAKLYHGAVAVANDVTPYDAGTAERVATLPGPFFVVVYPGDPVTIGYMVLAAAVAAVVVSAAMQQQKVPTVALRNTQSSSPNNALSDRQNSARPKGRIPDIFGTVRATPDLLAVPYKVFVDSKEVEYAYMCIGRGAYAVSDVRDDTTLVAEIAGTAVAVYAPGTSPNSGDAPQLQIGDPISEPVLYASRSNAVNGQVLRAPNGNTMAGVSVLFQSPNTILASGTAVVDFAGKFASGDSIAISNATLSGSYTTETREILPNPGGSIVWAQTTNVIPSQYATGAELRITNAVFGIADSPKPKAFNINGTYTISSVSVYGTTGNYTVEVALASASSVNAGWANAGDEDDTALATLRTNGGSFIYNLNGTYTIATVAAGVITLASPSSVNSDWGTPLSGATPTVLTPTLSTAVPQWVGPFTLDIPVVDHVYANFVAMQGLYLDNGTEQLRTDVDFTLECTPVDASGTARGAVETVTGTLEGSAIYRDQRAVTVKYSVASPGRYKVRAKRTSNTNTGYDGTVVDEVKWQDVFAMADVAQEDFGNVTTVQTLTFATEGALAIKSRKLNMLATRKLPAWSGSAFSSTLYATNNAADILCAAALDPYIGNRVIAELDVAQIYSEVAEVSAYFGHAHAAEFSYTIDADNMSFEETVGMVSGAVFCTAYRQGSILRLNFEKATTLSRLLFNHRNKLPGTETRTIRFGNADKLDGVVYTYVDPADDAVVTKYLPSSGTAVNPKELESAGVRTHLQAYFHAQREWAKIRYQNTAVEFTATQEADVLVNQDRILVADNTRPDTQDGEVLAQTGLMLTLSQPVTFVVGKTYIIFLQYKDATVGSIGITAGPTSDRVILASAPAQALVMDSDTYARATYVIAASDDSRVSAFLLSEKAPQGNFTTQIKAVNYDARYYERDLDYVNGDVDVNGNLI